MRLWDRRLTAAARQMRSASTVTADVLVAGVGYQFLRDMSVGPEIVTRLRQLDWPDTVQVEDLSFGPIAVVQRFEDRPEPYRRAVFIAAVERGRERGTVHLYRWEPPVHDAAEVQARVGEAVTGVISLDNLLVIAHHFGVLPPDVRVIEVEPIDTGWGPGFTAPVDSALDQIIALARREALEKSDD